MFQIITSFRETRLLKFANSTVSLNEEGVFVEINIPNSWTPSFEGSFTSEYSYPRDCTWPNVMDLEKKRVKEFVEHLRKEIKNKSIPNPVTYTL